MSMYQKEPNSFNLQVSQKISIRNHIDKEKRYKNKMPLIAMADQRQLNSPPLTAKSPKSTLNHAYKANIWNRNDNKGPQGQYNCFENVSTFKKAPERPIGY